MVTVAAQWGQRTSNSFTQRLTPLPYQSEARLNSPCLSSDASAGCPVEEPGRIIHRVHGQYLRSRQGGGEDGGAIGGGACCRARQAGQSSGVRGCQRRTPRAP